MSAIRTFPFEFEMKKEVLFYPKKEESISGDILEIGPGRGDMLMEMAQKNLAIKYVAVEISKKRYFRLIPRLEKKNIKNVLLIGGDIRVVMAQYLIGSFFEKIFVLFPDPWPKKRHAFRRLLNTEMLTLLGEHLRPVGELIVATDVEGYAQWVDENVGQLDTFEKLKPESDSAFPLAILGRTFFEEKWKAEGRIIHYLWYKKRILSQ